MFSRNAAFMWIGILLPSLLLLTGCPCVDYDGDGYGETANPACTYPIADCDDANADIYPGAPEVCDFLDNQCEGDSGYGDVDEGEVCIAPIPSGCFDMGDSSDGCGYAGIECPVHNVCITAFEMDVHGVTNAEYAECVADGGACSVPSDFSSPTRGAYYGNPDYDNFPVIYVDWYDAEDYCTWAGKRLPTEAEWEYAARGGLANNRFPWGNTITESDANYYESGDPWDNDTSRVMHYEPNGYGLYDMAGNVWEWVNDRFDVTYGYYQYCVDHGIVQDPPGPTSGLERVVRSPGSYGSILTDNMRVAKRNWRDPIQEGDALGFRCVRGGAYGP